VPDIAPARAAVKLSTSSTRGISRTVAAGLASLQTYQYNQKDIVVVREFVDRVEELLDKLARL
jgi:hypothetical protein